MPLMRNDKGQWLETIWDALGSHRENCIPEGEPSYDAQWDDICTAMAWLTESLSLELNDHGDYIGIEQ
jgi:hypothetical protein